MAMREAPDLEHIVWLLYRNAIREHIARDTGPAYEGEDKYRERAEKAGLIAVVNFVGKAYQVKP